MSLSLSDEDLKKYKELLSNPHLDACISFPYETLKCIFFRLEAAEAALQGTHTCGRQLPMECKKCTRENKWRKAAKK